NKNRITGNQCGLMLP
ncbi:hypothetical protein D022_1859B, partial [Vibrio parahaemolyticus 12310]